LQNPVEINIAVSKPPEQIIQEAFVVYEKQKSPLVKHLLKLQDYTRVIVFCSKKQNVKSLTSDLKRARFSVAEIHSDLEQDVREQVLQDFRNKKTKILVATDILSRGIDIDEIELVINYDVPNDGEDYIHRIGRTARAQTKGTAYTFITESEPKRRFLRNSVRRLLIIPQHKKAIFDLKVSLAEESLVAVNFGKRNHETHCLFVVFKPVCLGARYHPAHHCWQIECENSAREALRYFDFSGWIPF
jgi:superfamily II DNA/RNA helicase